MAEQSTHTTKRRLLAARTQAVKRLRAIDADIAAIKDEAELSSTDDEHDPEGSTLAFERSQSSALAESTSRQIAEIDAALARIDAGTFGICEGCGSRISSERLEARPMASLCLTCASTR